MTIDALDASATGFWLTAMFLVARSRPHWRHTTLLTVWPWLWAAMLSWSLFSLLGLFPATALQPVRSYLGYLAAIASVLPAIAVLGSRRPTCRAWPLFVLCPLAVVLSWPTVTIALAAGWSRPLQLEPPHVWIFGLVVVMGFGNYLGTRLSFPALLTSGGLIGAVAGLSTSFVATPEMRLSGLSCASFSAAVSVLLAAWLLRKPIPGQLPLEKVWQEFFILYGLVWSRRLLDRLQLLSDQQQWGCQFTPHGLVWSRKPTPEILAAMDHAFRWLLRRFVDPPWLDARLPVLPKPTASPQLSALKTEPNTPPLAIDL